VSASSSTCAKSFSSFSSCSRLSSFERRDRSSEWAVNHSSASAGSAVDALVCSTVVSPKSVSSRYLSSSADGFIRIVWSASGPLAATPDDDGEPPDRLPTLPLPLAWLRMSEREPPLPPDMRRGSS